ncbi:IscS subfamily cysteine desulfurase [Niallia sp. Krafla_26]|uniref:IscS subfamily cysteine desulfurase n=1 Tax=Niallia sp. Krafla_26 TaxID=3064703 RepID=UPI003D17A196
MKLVNYFDYAASTPLDSEAAKVYMEAATTYFGNTGSLHDMGTQAKDLLENCRREFAGMLGVESSGIYFTSGGSESNFLGIQALLSAKKKEGFHIISGVAEHGSIRSTLNSLSQQNYEVTLLPLNEQGRIDVEKLKAATREDTVLIVIQHANSEIGSVQPVQEIAAWCKEKEILFHCDTVHSFAKMDLKPITPLIDSLSISSHKFYGPKGIGIAYVNPKLAWKPFYPGTSHENGFRPGTVNVPAIAAMTVAAQRCHLELKESLEEANQLRKSFLSLLEKEKDTITVYGGSGDEQIPYTIGLRLHGLEGQWVMLECNRLGFAISTGSACSTGLQSASKTMVAMEIPEKIGKEFIRISFGDHTTEQELSELAQALIGVIEGAR